MTTTLAEGRIELSKQMGDYWAGTTTSAGTTTTLVDTELQRAASDWISDEAYDLITSSTSYIFTVSAADVTAGATYTNNSVTFTALADISSGTTLYCHATSAPAASGTLTKATGTGDNTITFSAYSTCDDEERKVSSLLTSTLTTLAHTGYIATGTEYEVHRLFAPSEKQRALIYAAKGCFPHLFKKIWNEEMVSGNWLKDGSFEIWTTSSALTHWTKSASTLTQTSTAYFFEHGAYCCKIDTAAGYIQQTVSNWDDLKRLAGKSVTFTVRGWCDTASNLRISIDDGTTENFSSYHDGDSAWTPREAPLSVTAVIKKDPTEITFKIHHELEAATETSYVDDARAICPGTSPRLYIKHLALAQDRAHQIFIEPTDYSMSEPWERVRDAKVDPDGHLYIPTTYKDDHRLRIVGIGYLDFLSSGAVSTAWDSTIEVDEPQLKILIAEAILYLYQWMSMPNYESGTREAFQQALAFWEREALERKAQFGMRAPAATVHWGIR